MNRRRFVSTSARSLLSMALLTTLCPVFALAPEPTYTITLPGNIVINLRIESITGPDGRRKVRVWNQSPSIAKSVLQIDTSMLLDTAGKPLSSRIFFGANTDQGTVLEAVRTANGFTVREPALSGNLKFGAPLFVPLIAELFIGKLYDFKQGGPQTFAQLLDSFVSTAKIDTLTLTAEGAPETIELPDGPVKARKLRYVLNEPLVPEPMRTGIFYVGPKGEVLRCDTAFFGVPIRAKGPAVYEDQGRRVILRFKNPDSGNRIVSLQGDRQPTGDWKIKLGMDGQADSFATLACDKGFRLTHMETPWHGRPFMAAVVATDTVHWTLAGGTEQQATIPSDASVWFLPHWFATDTWEGTGGTFAKMTMNDTRDGFLFGLFMGQRDAVSFTLERLADSATVSRSGSSLALHHYRFYTGGKQAVPEAVLPGNAPKPPPPRFDLYTDGSRLVVFLASDGIKIIRNGWETFAATLTAPSAADPVAPAAPPEP